VRGRRCIYICGWATSTSWRSAEEIYHEDANWIELVRYKPKQRVPGVRMINFRLCNNRKSEYMKLISLGMRYSSHDAV
jgi:hypothetical protein